MSKNLFGTLTDTPPRPELDLSAVGDIAPPPVAPEALRAAQLVGEAHGFKGRRGEGGGRTAVAPKPVPPAPPAPRTSGRVRVREVRSAEPEIGRGMQKATLSALVPVDILERFIALETDTGARRWHLLNLALDLLEARGDTAALTSEVKAALQAWSAVHEGGGA